MKLAAMTTVNMPQRDQIACKMHVGFTKCREGARLPTQSHHGEDIGFDIYSAISCQIPPFGTEKIDTGLAFAFRPDPPGISSLLTPFFKIEGRSGLAAQGIFPVGGILDLGYRGEISAIIHNSTSEPWNVEIGDRIAQLVCYLTFTNANGILMNFYEAHEQEESRRGSGGFGSTGV